MSWTLFHFLRPWWFLALIPMTYFVWRLWQGKTRANSWHAVCDPHLLSHLIKQSELGKSRWPIILYALALLSLIIALAGPTWSRLPQPIFQNIAARVIIMNLSSSMNATDVKPSRLARAKYKLRDLLKQSREGQTGLIVYSGQAHVVSPLTQDSNTIMALVPQLSPDIMPTQGDNLAEGLQQAVALLEQGSAKEGQIIVITDTSPNANAYRVANEAADKGYAVSVLGVGTIDGSPVPIRGGGFQKARDGAIILSKLDPAALRRLAQTGEGQYMTFTNNDRDITTLLQQATLQSQQQLDKNEALTEKWQDEGRWFLIPALLFALLAFRRGWLEAVLP